MGRSFQVQLEQVKAGAIVVLGCQHKERMQQRLVLGVQIWKQQKQQGYMVLTGYAGNYTQSEASIMASWAINFGVKPSAILIEDKARNTIENALYSKQLLKNVIRDYIIVVTSDFHVTRSQLLFETVFSEINIEAQTVGCRPSILSEHENIKQIYENELRGTLQMKKLISKYNFQTEWLWDRSLTHPHIFTKCG
eukprot:TRINITY_DN2203_c0_g2_i3.p1 TRINITY_DN2203_c0_g2~~TRINITY_DN2203_c0_g2_i3.p1  ORF type:complete len:194 (-),score=18.43 TRINITY_DN2203_c0_g2_i3:64-645(-)